MMIVEPAAKRKSRFGALTLERHLRFGTAQFGSGDLQFGVPLQHVAAHGFERTRRRARILDASRQLEVSGQFGANQSTQFNTSPVCAQRGGLSCALGIEPLGLCTDQLKTRRLAGTDPNSHPSPNLFGGLAVVLRKARRGPQPQDIQIPKLDGGNQVTLGRTRRGLTQVDSGHRQITTGLAQRWSLQRLQEAEIAAAAGCNRRRGAALAARQDINIRVGIGLGG